MLKEPKIYEFYASLDRFQLKASFIFIIIPEDKGVESQIYP